MSKSSPSLWWSKSSAISRYAIAVLSIALALVATQLADAFLHIEPFVSLFLCAIMFVAWFGGFGPGLLATALAFLAFYYYLIPPINSFAVKFNSFAVEIQELPRLALFVIAAIFVNLLSSSQRHTAESLQRSRDDLLAAIEDQKRIADTLQHSEMYLAEAQRLSHTGSLGWNASSGKIFWSEETFRIFEYDKAPSATVDMVLKRTHPEDLALVRSTIGRASKDGKDFDLEHRLLMPDGSVKHVHVVAHALSDKSGGVEFVGAVLDVTAAKRAAEELHKAQTELAHVTRVTTLGELTASIAHEVNQPLAAVITNAGACLRWLDRATPDLDEARGAVDRIIKDGNRASEVIRRVRALANKTGSEKVLLDINDVVNEVIVLVQRELVRHRVPLRIELAPALPMVLADRVQLQQVIINLVINGIEAMQAVTDVPRQLTIRTTHQDEARQVLVAVEDCGIGISAEKAGQLFNAFFTTKSGGMGMGLSICRSIVEDHGGRMWASDNAGPGATFQFTLPAYGKAAST